MRLSRMLKTLQENGIPKGVDVRAWDEMNQQSELLEQATAAEGLRSIRAGNRMREATQLAEDDAYRRSVARWGSGVLQKVRQKMSDLMYVGRNIQVNSLTSLLAAGAIGAAVAYGLQYLGPSEPQPQQPPPAAVDRDTRNTIRFVD